MEMKMSVTRFEAEDIMTASYVYLSGFGNTNATDNSIYVTDSGVKTYLYKYNTNYPQGSKQPAWDTYADYSFVNGTTSLKLKDLVTVNRFIENFVDGSDKVYLNGVWNINDNTFTKKQ